MFAKYKNKDNVFKDLIMYQKPLKTLYQQLVINGYTDTEEQFLDKVLKIVQGKERQEIDNLITTLTNNLESTNNILSSVKSASERNKTDISKNKKDINTLIKKSADNFSYLRDEIGSVNDRVDNIDENKIPNDGTENQVLLKGDNKNVWKSFDEIPITLQNVSTENEILAIFQIQSKPFTLGKFLNENPDFEIYIDGVLSNNMIEKNSEGEFVFKIGTSEKIVDIEIYGDRKKDILKYNQDFLKTITSIDEIFLNYDPYNNSVHWLNTSAFFSHNSDLIEIGKIVIGDRALKDSTDSIFQYCYHLRKVSEIDLGPCTVLDNAFSDCLFTEDLSLLKIDTSKVINMDYMFSNCNSLKKIPQLNTSSVTDMRYMFRGCKKLTSIPQLNTSNVIRMDNMFENCYCLTTIPQLDTSNVTNMENMFENCTSLTTIPLLDTSKVIGTQSMFYGCTSLTTIPQLNTSKVTGMQSMFKGCTSLTTIPLLDTSKLTDMTSMFADCTSLITIPALDTNKVTSMNNMFEKCTSLERVEGLNVSKIHTTGDIFSNCSKLSYVKLTSIYSDNLQFAANTLPTHQGAATDAYILDLTECTIDVSSVTAPAGWTIKLPTSGGVQ